MQDVAQRGPGPRGDDADPGRQCRQRLLVPWVEEPLGCQFLLQGLEPPPQHALAGFLQVLNHQLELAPGFVEPDAAARQNLAAVAHLEPDQQVALPEHGTADLGGRVLEGEVPVPGPGTGEVGHLALEPY